MRITAAQFRIVACMYLGYGAMMISRQMVTILSPALLKDESLGFTVKDTGDILAFGTIGAMMGKVVWGPLADRIGGRLTFLLGVSLTGLLITAFGLSYNVLAFTIFSALSYATKSSGWPGMTKMVGHWFHPSTYGRTWSLLSTSSRASVFLGTLLFGWLLSFFHWRVVAFISTATALLIYFICRHYLREKPEDPDFLEKHGQRYTDPEQAREMAAALENQRHHPLAGTTLFEGLRAFATSVRCFWVFIMLMALTCAMAILDFVPAYLLQVYKLTASRAAMASAVMPLGSLIGVILSMFFYDRFSKKQLRFILAAMLTLAVGCIVVLRYLPRMGLDAGASFIGALAMILLFGISIAPSYYIPMSIFSIEFGGPHSATLVSAIDMVAFAASATFGFIAGRLVYDPGFGAGAAGHDWSGFMNFMLGIGTVAVLSTWFFMHGEYRAAQKEAAALEAA